MAPLCCEYPLLISVMFVLVPPEWIVKPHDMEAVEGQDVFFPCRVSGVPEPSIIWRKLAGKQSSSVHCTMMRFEKMSDLISYGINVCLVVCLLKLG